jgi:formylglycine-generating enzyme required for sulfatase activity
MANSPTPGRTDRLNSSQGPNPAAKDATLTPPPVTRTPGGSGDRPRLAPGERPLPDFVLVAKLGEGGFGEVWKARGPGGIDVALKFIALGDRVGEVELRALELIKGIRHPHLVGLFGAWQQDDQLILAMDLADGTLLDCLNAALLQGHQGIPRPELLEYMREAAKGLDHLNSINIQHQDVKPQNLLLVGGGVKVADFGLAKVLQHSVTGKSHGGLSLAYAPPEFHDRKTTRWSDQYSLAVSYCQLRGGRLPFGGSAREVMIGHVMHPPDLTMLPEAERAAVARALSKEPKERWPSCREFVEALARVGGASATREVTQRRTPEPLPDTKQTGSVRSGRWRCRWLLLARLFLLLGLGLALLLFGPERVGMPRISDEALALDLGRGVKLELIYVKKGEFWMGASEGEEKGADDDNPRHRVQITKPFWLGKYAVTQEEYARLIGKPDFIWFCAEGTGKDKVRGMDTRRFPAEWVSWEDATAFCEELNRKHLSQLPELRRAGYKFRLPTEAQWEYACRAGTETPFHFGKDLNGTQANCKGTEPYGTAVKGPYLERTCQVGSYDANFWGLYDMHGNVWQWCADYYDPNFYRTGPLKDPFNGQRAAEDCRILRGGSWDMEAGLCRAAYRGRGTPGDHQHRFGFRVALCLD